MEITLRSGEEFPKRKDEKKMTEKEDKIEAGKES